MKEGAIMNLLPRDKQIEIISALCEGIGQRAAIADLAVIISYDVPH
jgi:hypothetical protein